MKRKVLSMFLVISLLLSCCFNTQFATNVMAEEVVPTIDNADDGSCHHVYTNYVSNNDATCQADGTKTATCDNGCGTTKTVTDEGSKVPHKYTTNIPYYNGKKIVECDYGCGESKAQLLALDEMTRVELSEAEPNAGYTFIPEQNGYYTFYSMVEDERETIYCSIYSEGSRLISTDGANNFCVQIYMEAGKLYDIDVRFRIVGDYYASFDVVMKKLVPATSIQIDGEENLMGSILDTFSLSATLYPENAIAENITWSTSDSSVATVDENGYVVPVSAGNVVITATSENGLTDTCTITVKDFPLIEANEQTMVEIIEGGQSAYYRFIPKEDGFYAFYATANYDTYGYIYDADMNQLASDDDGGNNGNFKIKYQLEAGKTYILRARYYSSSNTGTFDVCLEKEKEVESIEVVSGTSKKYIENYDGYWGERYDEEIGWVEGEEVFYYDYNLGYVSDAVIRINYKDGTSKTAHVGDEVDGHQITWDDNQYEQPWVVGTNNQSTISYLGATVNLPITVIEYPVESIELVSGTAKTYIENSDGYWGEWYNEETGEYENVFYYNTSLSDPFYSVEDVSDAVIKINYKDGTSRIVNVGDEVDGELVWWYDNQYEEPGFTNAHPWTLGENQTVILYLNERVNMPITVIGAMQFEESGVIVDAAIDVMDEDAVLVVEPKNISEINVTDAGDYNLDTAVTYDIYFKKGDEIVQPDGTVTVSLPVPAGMNGDKCKVFHIDEDGNMTDMNAQYVDGYMVFQTSHFSYYAIMERSGDTLIGDVNSDGTIDARDITFLRRYYVGWDVTIDEIAADVNADNVIDARDITILRRYYVGWDIELG